MTPSCLIREGRPGDDIACGRIIAAASLASSLPARLPELRGILSAAGPLQPRGRQRVVAEIGGMVAGFADFAPGDGHVRHLFVTPERQGSGIAGALIDHVQQIIGGAVTVHCMAVNDAALKWYLRRGFVIASGWLDPDWNGAEIVWLRLCRDTDIPGSAPTL